MIYAEKKLCMCECDLEGVGVGGEDSVAGEGGGEVHLGLVQAEDCGEEPFLRAHALYL